jgi:hypothetical protein
VGRKIDQSSAGSAQALSQQRQVVWVMPSEVVNEHVRRRENRTEKPEDERRHENRADENDGKDRQWRAHHESEEDDSRHLDAVQGITGCDGGERRVLFDRLGR